MEVCAIAKNIRISSRKLKPVVAKIKKLEPQKALVTLSFINKSQALPLKKVIASAIANAKHNFGAREDSLKFKKIDIGKGRILKRYRAVSRGRVHQIRKRTVNIKVVLEAEPEAKRGEVKETEEKKDEQKETKAAVAK
jgi:large subunit ribosomal protein L22